MSYLVEEVSCTLAIKHVLKYVPGAKFQFYESVKKKSEILWNAIILQLKLRKCSVLNLLGF